MLEIAHLYKNYGKFRAVNDLSLAIEDGSIFGFVGPNGAGKTTVFKIISGLLQASQGSVWVNGVDVIHRPKELKSKIGYMPDFFGVYDNLKVDEYMDFYAGTYFIPYAERPQLIDNLLDIVDLSDKKHAYVDTLSRGMKQRLCLARSLVHDPEVLILDEPASGLDPRARIDMKEVLKQLRTLGKTILISSHILTELAELCTTIGIMDHGVMVASGSINDIMKNLYKSRKVYVRPLRGMDELLVCLKEYPDVVDIWESVEHVEFSFAGGDEELAGLLGQIVARNIPVLDFHEKAGNLEELFMTLTQQEARDVS